MPRHFGASLRPVAIVDLGFGDAGKGLVTDFLSRALGARLVVRFNGGAQAGHNVVTRDGRHHTFSQFGAGTFVPGVRTHLSRHVVVHPTAMLVEARALSARGEPDCLERLSVDGRALVVTPFHQAACRLREMARGASKHGSCGVGVGEVVVDALSHGEDVVRIRDLADGGALSRRLDWARERVRATLADSMREAASHAGARAEVGVLEDRGIADEWVSAIGPLVGRVTVASDEVVGVAVRRNERVLFEGAQGVLLDQDWGFHPYTTWSRCTLQNAREILDEADAQEQLLTVGVARIHAHRHGPGPLPTESAELRRELEEPHNVDGPWQGPFRVGWPDLVLARYARGVCGSLDALALTHLDALAGRDSWPVSTRYDAGGITDCELVDPGHLQERSMWTQRLLAARPDYVEVAARELPAVLAAAYGAPIAITSRGPAASDVEMRGRA